MKDELVLLRACYELLKKQEQSPLRLDLLTETITYKGEICDGWLLMQDIGEFLGENVGRRANQRRASTAESDGVELKIHPVK